MDSIDLRSDTVTHPTPAMREAMARAEVGDDVYGDDPTVNQLEALSAEMLGKPAAMFVPSGTMGNLTAILSQCARGEEVILGKLSHTFRFEAGGIAALGGVHPHTLPNAADGTIELGQIRSAIRPDNEHFPRTRLIALENTHNLCMGAVLTPEYTQLVGQLAAEHGLRLHIDGARIFNAAAATGHSAAELAAPADSVTFCLSKALCAPVGSVVCGSQELIGRARRIRKQLGGGMRQAGVIAAAGIVALEQMAPRLGEDHRRARKLAADLTGIDGIEVLNPDPQSNMVYIRLDAQSGQDSASVASKLAEQGIKIVPRSETDIRLVTHYWIDDRAVDRTVAAFWEALA